MFKENTLFVVGAGASNEFGLPVGSGLSETIRQNSEFIFERPGGLKQGSHVLYRCIERNCQNTGLEGSDKLQERFRALRQIHDGIYLASSIDNFIDMHSHDPHIVEMGKLQIAYSISIAEKESKLFFNVNDARPELELAELKDTWIESFCRILFEKVQHDNLDLIGDNVSIICFNYDRCIEYYLIEAVRQTFVDVSFSDAHRIVSQMNIIHPYGTLGTLPDELRRGREETGSVPFGFDIADGFDPWPVLDQLKTYTEQVDDEAVVARIEGTVSKAKQIVFLGFAFHPQNMALMKVGKRTPLKRVYSTGRGISEQEKPEITARILKLYAGDDELPQSGQGVHIETGKSCSELFAMHWRNLSVS